MPLGCLPLSSLPTFANKMLVLEVVLALAVNLAWGLPPAQPGIAILKLQYAAILLQSV